MAVNDELRTQVREYVIGIERMQTLATVIARNSEHFGAMILSLNTHDLDVAQAGTDLSSELPRLAYEIVQRLDLDKQYLNDYLAEV